MPRKILVLGATGGTGREVMRAALLLAGCLIAGSPAWATDFATPEISGRVIEAESGAPIPGAIVIASIGGTPSSWSLNFGHGGASHVAVYCTALRADALGRFRLPAFKGGYFSTDLSPFGVNFNAYHRDYVFAHPAGGAAVHQQVRLIPLLRKPLAVSSEVVVPMRRFSKGGDVARWWSKVALPIDVFQLDCVGPDPKGQDLLWEAMREEVGELAAIETPHPFAGTTMNKLEKATGRPSSRPPAQVFGKPPQPTRIEAVQPSR